MKHLLKLTLVVLCLSFVIFCIAFTIAKILIPTNLNEYKTVTHEVVKLELENFREAFNICFDPPEE